MSVIPLHDWLTAGPWVLLAGLRWFGLLLLMPGLGQGVVPVRWKAGLAALLGAVMMPVLADQTRHGGGATAAWEWPLLAATELAVGAALGLGIRIVFAGLRVAGELIDQQAGLAAADVFNLDGSPAGTVSGQSLALAATAAFLCLTPIGGDLVLTASMLDLFLALPAGSASMMSVGDLLIVLVQRSLDLAWRLAAPVLAAASLVTIGGAWLARSCANWSLAPVGSPLRVVFCLVIVAGALAGTADVAAQTFRALLEPGPRNVLHDATRTTPGLTRHGTRE